MSVIGKADASPPLFESAIRVARRHSNVRCLVVGGVLPVVLRTLGDAVVAGGNQGAVHDQHGIFAEPLALAQSEGRPEMADYAVGSRLRDPEQQRELSQCHVRSPVRDDQ
jgi:hypothetical protein